jgi:transposase-like protein
LKASSSPASSPLPSAACALPEGTPAVELLYTSDDLFRDFPTDDICLEYIKEQLWPQGMALCQKCGVMRKHYRVSGRKAYACNHCGHHIYPLAGTIFTKSTTPLKTWFYILYLLLSTGGNISARQIQRETGVTYKTAWRSRGQILKLLFLEAPQSRAAKGSMNQGPTRAEHSAEYAEDA